MIPTITSSKSTVGRGRPPPVTFWSFDRSFTLLLSAPPLIFQVGNTAVHHTTAVHFHLDFGPYRPLLAVVLLTSFDKQLDIVVFSMPTSSSNTLVSALLKFAFLLRLFGPRCHVNVLELKCRRMRTMSETQGAVVVVK